MIRDGWITEEELAGVLPEIVQPERIPVGDAAVFNYRRQLLAMA
jgi:hypothetical protein